MFDGFFAAFGMYATVFPLLWPQRFKQYEVCFARGSELSNTLQRIALLVVAGSYPCILVESLDRRPGGGENLPQPPPNRDLRICDMSDNFCNGPFVWRRALAQFRRRRASC